MESAKTLKEKLIEKIMEVNNVWILNQIIKFVDNITRGQKRIDKKTLTF